MEYLSRFDFDIQYVKGSSNKVADSLSRYYQSDTDNDTCQTYDYVNADLVLDPEGEDLPWNRLVEIRAIREAPRKRPLYEAEEERGTLAKEMAKAARPKEALSSPTDEDDDPTLFESLSAGPELTKFVEKATDFLDKVRNGYKDDPLFSKIMEEKERYATFSVRDGFVYVTNTGKQEVLCIPRKVTKDYSLTATIIDQAHTILGHFGPQKTADYIRRWYWWPRMGNEITKFCDSCGICQANKTSTQRPVGLLHPLPIPNRPWGSIGMDFMGPFPESEGYDYLWVVICRLTSQVHLIPVKTTVKASELAWIYVKEVVRLHGLPDSIVSDRDSKFTSKFWRETHRLLGTKLLMSTAFHPQTDGATERANRSVGQVLRTMIRPDQRDWVEKLPMTEFTLNSSISSSTGFAPFELNYGFLPTFIGGISPTDEAKPGIKRFLNQAISNLEMAHDAIIESRVIQTRQANRRRRPEDKISEGDKVYLSTENLSLPKSRTRKLMPKFIGPYKVTSSHPAESRYTLDLPAELKARRIHPTFHVSRLRPYTKNDDTIFPKREVRAYYDFGDAEDNEWLVDEILAHRWEGNKVSFLLQWNLGDTTWEPYPECKELAALDRYLELLGIDDWKSLPRKTSAVQAKDTTNQSSSRTYTREKSMGRSPPTDASAPAAVRRSTRLSRN